MGTVHQRFCKWHGEDATNARAGEFGGASEALARFLVLSSWESRVQQHDLGRAARQGRAAPPKLRCFPWFQVLNDVTQEPGSGLYGKQSQIGNWSQKWELIDITISQTEI
jgi:hypothetical protein